MDRQIVYPGSIPLDTDILNIQRNTAIAIGYLAQALIGSSTIADGLVCAPTQPASLGITVGPGSLAQLGVVDASPFGSLPAEPTQPLVRLGINRQSIAFTLTPPGTFGQSITYLIQASMLEYDTTPVILPYYNATNPGQPYSGPANSGSAQMTQRLQSVELTVKAAPAAAIGSTSTPAVDVGWVGLYLITVDFGTSEISSADIRIMPGAPFVNWKIPQLSPGTRNLAVFQPATQGSWAAPAGVIALKLRLWGGGGAGGSGAGGAGGGGAGGGYSEGFYTVSPGQSFIVSVGNGGAGSGSGGGTTSFGGLASATGGHAGVDGSSGGSGGLIAGNGYGSGLGLSGELGGQSFNGGGMWLSGAGGGSHTGNGGVSAVGLTTGVIAGLSGSTPGGGGSGGIGTGLGGQGGAGLVLVEW